MRTTLPKAAGRDQWLEQRRPYFNASAASILWDRHPYMSAADYAAEKLGGAAQRETEAMRRGRWLEYSIADWYAEREGVTLYEPAQLYIADRIMATPDRFVIAGNERVVEIKTAKGYLDEPMQYWLDQCRAIMHCTGHETCDVVWMDSSLELQVVTVDPDPAFTAELVKRAQRFMAAIDMGIVPDWIVPDLTAAHVAAIHPSPAGDVELDEDTAALVHKYRDLRATKSEVERTMELIKNAIARKLGEHEAGTELGVRVVTFKPMKDAEVVDVKRLRDERPDIADQYISLRPGTRRFAVVP